MVCTIASGTSATYYVTNQSRYYTGGIEPTGRWYSPASSHGLIDGDEIDDRVFEQLHAGLDQDGGALTQNAGGGDATRVSGYDLTFSAPKSVSIVWAIADDDLRTEIEAAQDQAIRAALTLANDHATFSRRGRGGSKLERVSLSGALFQHGEARPVTHPDGSVTADPQLHSHAVMFNHAQRADGTFGALDGRHLFRWKMALGAAYRAELAHQLRRLGYEITSGERGLFELTGINPPAVEAFSSRRRTILDTLAEKGLRSADAPGLAASVTAATRTAKKNAVDQDRHVAWREKAASFGLSPQSLQALRCNEHQATQGPVDIAQAALAELTRHDAVFTMRDLYRRLAEDATRSGLDMAAVSSAAENLLREGQIIQLGADALDQVVYSTPEMVLIEVEVRERAQLLARTLTHRTDPAVVDQLCSEHRLSPEQSEAVRFVTAPGAIAVYQGSAGSGKSTALRAVTEAYQHAGFEVLGTSTAWRTATALGEECGIESRATASWLAQLKQKPDLFSNNTVLIADEAGLLSARNMHELLGVAQSSGAKLILVGDQQQLQAIEAGTGLRLVSDAIGASRVDTIRRQTEPWARQMVEDFRDGRSARAIESLRDRGLLKFEADRTRAVQALVDAWEVARHAAPDETGIVLARSNSEVRELNAAIRERLRAEGRIGPKDWQLQGADRASNRPRALSVAEGERIRFLKRIDQIGVINGSTASIEQIHPDGDGHVLIHLSLNDRTKVISTRDLMDETGRVPLAHAYASTLYSAQGLTVDRTFVLADESLSRNDVYVAASRAKQTTHIFVDRAKLDSEIRSEVPLGDRASLRPTDADRERFLARRWSTPREKTSSLDWDVGTEVLEALKEHAATANLTSHMPSNQKNLSPRIKPELDL